MAFNATYTSSDLSPIITNALGKTGIEVGNNGGLIGVGLGLFVVVAIGTALVRQVM